VFGHKLLEVQLLEVLGVQTPRILGL
jgi:hypothetical protein